MLLYCRGYYFCIRPRSLNCAGLLCTAAPSSYKTTIPWNKPRKSPSKPTQFVQQYPTERRTRCGNPGCFPSRESKAGQHHIHELELSTDPRSTDLRAQPERATQCYPHGWKNSRAKIGQTRESAALASLKQLYLLTSWETPPQKKANHTLSEGTEEHVSRCCKI